MIRAYKRKLALKREAIRVLGDLEHIHGAAMSPYTPTSCATSCGCSAKTCDPGPPTSQPCLPTF